MPPRFQKEFPESEYESKADKITHTAYKRTVDEVYIEEIKGENPEALLQSILRNSNTNALDAFPNEEGKKGEKGICAVVDCINTIDRPPTFQEWNKHIPEYHPMKLFDFCQDRKSVV